ncbi:MAG: hypothetical protein WAQ28_07465 [Bacteroidia bacterium]
MNAIPQLLKDLRALACLLLLMIIGWQQWTTYTGDPGQSDSKGYHSQFLNPIQYTEQVYKKDDITAYAGRFEEVKQIFKTPTTLSYVGEAVVPNNGTREMHYALTQYYMAPHVLLRNETARDRVVFNNGASPPTLSNRVCDTVLYNLYTSRHIDPSSNYHLNNGWKVIKDFDNGIIVLAR